jgi:hypothetical protein
LVLGGLFFVSKGFFSGKEDLIIVVAQLTAVAADVVALADVVEQDSV